MTCADIYKNKVKRSCPNKYIKPVIKSSVALVCLLSVAAQAQITPKPLVSNYTSSISAIVYKTSKKPSLNAACDAIKPILEIEIEALPQETLNKTLGFKALTQEASFAWEPYVDKVRSLNLGYTDVEYQVSYTFASKVAEHETQTVSCAVPGVKLKLGFKRIEIKVASELQTNNCLEAEVIAHEKKHVLLYKSALLQAKEKIETNLMSKLSEKVFLADTPEAAIAQANLYLESFVYDDALDELDNIRALHSSIDTPQEYARMANVCQGFAQRFSLPHK